MKHFLHLWSETPLARAIAGIDPAQETFLENWRIAREDGRDICFVRYEALNDVWSQIGDFLSLNLPAEVLRQEFSPRDRDVPPDVAKRFATLENDLSACPAFVGFPKKAHAPMPAPPTQHKIDLSGSVFTVSDITAGAADAIGRIAFVHDIFSSAANIPFLLPEYKKLPFARTGLF